MSYEYAPRGLQFFVKDIVENPPKLTLRHQGASVYRKYAGEIRPTFDRFIQANDLEGFQKWTQTFRPRQFLTLATLFSVNLDERWKRALLLSIQEAITQNHRMFRILLDVLYETCSTSYLWPHIQTSYQTHKVRIQKRISPELHEVWEEYMTSSDPVSYLDDRVHKSKQLFTSAMTDFYLENYHKFFREVLFKVFASAKAPFYNRESALYRSTFQKAPAGEQQSMAASLIRNCVLNEVAELGKFLYEQMGTYLKRPSLWHLVPDAERRKFASWIMRNELQSFFQGVNQSHERYLYWQKYAPSLEDVVIINHKQTMVMYFRDVVIMEVLGVGAVYVYSRRVFEDNFGQKIRNLVARREFEPDADISREDVRDMELVYNGTGRLAHRRQWQYEFDGWLQRNLSWEVDARVLAFEENQAN